MRVVLAWLLLGGCSAGPRAPRAGSDAAVPDASTDLDAGPDASPDAAVDAAVPTEWPNFQSHASSDPWIAENHERIRVMRPKVLALNFVNARTNDEMALLLDQIIAGFREGSKNHGYDDPDAPAFLEYEIAKAVDLRDDPIPPGWTLRNSTLYPREEPQDGSWGFDYERLFTEEFADLYAFADPDDPGANLDLCELVDRGLVHEVWIYGDADVPDVSAAEVLELKPLYDEDRRRIEGEDLNGCAGNGCWDWEDTVPDHCTRSIRIGWVNNTRGPGCYVHSYGHGIEWTANVGRNVPYLTRYFDSFADFDLDTRFGLPFDSWYACSRADCLSFTGPSSVDYVTDAASGTLDPYVPRCGNVHLAPNSRGHYDDRSPEVVTSTCEGWRQGGGPGGSDEERPFSTDLFSAYDDLVSDCGGGWQIFWRQSMPGLGNEAKDDDGQPMLNWWPFLFY